MVRRSDALYQPAAGVYTDFENILQKFAETDTVRYEKFAEIWRETKMSYFYAGRQSDREVREFIEECFRIAIKFWLPPYNFQVRVGGLYLIYGIYLTQPVVPKVRVRVTLSQWQSIKVFQTEAHQQQHWDVDFVFQKLRLNNAFYFVATDIDCYPTLKDVISEEIAIPDEFKEETSVLYDLFSGDVLEQFSSIHQHYHKMKVSLEGPRAFHPSRSLDVINSDLVSGVTHAISHYQERRKSHSQHTKKIYSRSDSEDENVKSSYEDDGDLDYKPWTESSRKSKIKAKAFKQVAKAHRSRRHRQALKEHSSKRKSKKSKNINPEENSELTSDFNTATEEEDGYEEGHVSDNTAIISMPTLTEEVLEERETKGTGKKRISKTDGDLSPKKKNKNSKRKSVTSETDEDVASPKKRDKSKSPKKRSVTSDTEEAVTSPKKRRKMDSAKNKQKNLDKEEMEEKKSPKKIQNEVVTQEATEEGGEKSKEKKQPRQTKKNKNSDDKIVSVNDESENSQEKVTEINTNKTSKKKNPASESKTQKNRKTKTDKMTEGTETHDKEDSQKVSPVARKNPKGAGKRKADKIEIEIVNDETENVTVMSTEKQSKLSEDKTMKKTTKRKKKVSETETTEKATEGKNGTTEKATGSKNGTTEKGARNKSGTTGRKGGKSKKNNKKTLHVKFQIQPKHASK